MRSAFFVRLTAVRAICTIWLYSSPDVLRTPAVMPRTMFTPRPNVDSAVVRIDFEQDRIPVQSVGAYRAVVRCAFSGRRKTLENNLMNTFRLSREQAKEMLSEAGIADMARGETLTPAQFARLADVLTEHRCTDGQ